MSNPGPWAAASARRLAPERRNAWPRGPLALARAWLVNPYAVLDEGRALHGPTFWLPLPFSRSALVTEDPEIVRRVAADPSFLAGPGARALRGVIGETSLITVDGEAHARQRKALAPLFRAPRLEAFDAIGRDAFTRALDALGEAPVYGAAQRAGLEMIAAFLVPERRAAVVSAVESLMRSFQSPLFLFVEPLRIRGGGLLPWGIFQRRIERLRALIASDDEILALLLFGHDTTAAAFAWTAQLVLADPARRARAEHDAEFRLACVRESLRLRPVVPHVTRVATRRTELNGFVIEPGVSVYPSAYLAHQNEAVFPDARAFRPERFLSLKAEPRPSQYFPFGLGDKACIGKALAERQMVVMLEALVKHPARFQLVGDTLERPRRKLLLVVPEHGTVVEPAAGARRLGKAWVAGFALLAWLAVAFGVYQNRLGGVGGAIALPKVLWLSLTIAQWFLVPALVLAEGRLFGRARLAMRGLLLLMLARVPIEGVMIYVTMSWKCGYGMAHDAVVAVFLLLAAARIRPRTRADRVIRWHVVAMAAMFVVEAYFANRFFDEIRATRPELYYVPDDARFEGLLDATRLGVAVFGLELAVFLAAWRSR